MLQIKNWGPYLILQLVATTIVAQSGSDWGWHDAIEWFIVITVIVGWKRRQIARWWHAWDEKGRPIDVEVLPPAPIAKA
jgi:hypothetical protein